MMKLQSLATVIGASSAGGTNQIFFADAEFEAELPSSFNGKTLSFSCSSTIIFTSGTHYNQLSTLLFKIYVDFRLKVKITKILTSLQEL